MNTDIVNTNIENLTFMELWEEYNKYLLLKYKKQSYRKVLNNFNTHILGYFKYYRVKDITAKIYVKWMLEIEEKDYSNAYKKSLHGCMVSILNYAIAFYDLNYNIASRVGGFNKNKSRKKNIDFWTFEEFQTFIAVVDNDLYKLLFNILYFSGMRIGECLALTWNDFKEDYIDINKTISKDFDSEGNYIINSPKTDSSFRKIKLDTEIINSLNKLYKEQSKLKDFDKSWFIFGGSKPLSQTTIGRKKNKYCDIAKVKKIRLHDFRHSHATLLLSLGAPITVISKRLGHADIAMTLNTYSHLIPNDELKAINLINNIKSKVLDN